MINKGFHMNELEQMHCTAVTASTPRLSDREINEYKLILPDWWSYEKDGELHLEKVFTFKDFNQAVTFTNKVAQAANEEDHHPAILTEWGKVTVTWWTHKIKGLHLNDFIMAAKTDKLNKAGV
jgi:4a-hydroxytetrahydrobiopterin dehydratase